MLLDREDTEALPSPCGHVTLGRAVQCCKLSSYKLTLCSVIVKLFSKKDRIKTFPPCALETPCPQQRLCAAGEGALRCCLCGSRRLGCQCWSVKTQKYELQDTTEPVCVPVTGPGHLAGGSVPAWPYSDRWAADVLVVG